jgi:hypothetical protein
MDKSLATKATFDAVAEAKRMTVDKYGGYFGEPDYDYGAYRLKSFLEGDEHATSLQMSPTIQSYYFGLRDALRRYK